MTSYFSNIPPGLLEEEYIVYSCEHDWWLVNRKKGHDHPILEMCESMPPPNPCLFQGCACRIWCHAISAACDICTTCNREFPKILPCDDSVIHINLPGQRIMINSSWAEGARREPNKIQPTMVIIAGPLQPISDSKPLPTNYCFPGHDDPSMM